MNGQMGEWERGRKSADGVVCPIQSVQRKIDIQDKKIRGGVTLRRGLVYMSGFDESRGTSAVFFNVLNGIDNLVHELEGHTGDNTFGVCEGALKGAEGNTSFLGRDAGEERCDGRENDRIKHGGIGEVLVRRRRHLVHLLVFIIVVVLVRELPGNAVAIHALTDGTAIEILLSLRRGRCRRRKRREVALINSL